VTKAWTLGADCLAVAAALLGGEAGTAFLEKHAAAQAQYAKAIERAQDNRKVVTAANLQGEGIRPGPKMGALLEEAEAIAVAEGLDDASAVLDKLRASVMWESAASR
jgi:hypothetical protein